MWTNIGSPDYNVIDDNSNMISLSGSPCVTASWMNVWRRDCLPCMFASGKFVFMWTLSLVHCSVCEVHALLSWQLLAVLSIVEWNSCQSWVASFLTLPYRSSSSSPYTSGRVSCSSERECRTCNCVLVGRLLITKCGECKWFWHTVQLVLSFTRCTALEMWCIFLNLSLQASFSAWPQRWQPLLPGRKEQRGPHGKENHFLALPRF